jgi:hypothetical protein
METYSLLELEWMLEAATVSGIRQDGLKGPIYSDFFDTEGIYDTKPEKDEGTYGRLGID